MTHIQRNTAFDPERNMTTSFGEKLAGCPYDEELAGPDGMHFHVWVLKGTTQARLREIRKEIQASRDLVSMSYDYLPDEEIELKDTNPASIEVLQAMVKEGSMAKLRWPDGRKQVIDLFSASAIVKVYEALNESNREKFEGILAKGPGGLLKLAQISFSMMR